jgi:hypothetical protein
LPFFVSFHPGSRSGSKVPRSAKTLLLISLFSELLHSARDRREAYPVSRMKDGIEIHFPVIPEYDFHGIHGYFEFFGQIMDSRTLEQLVFLIGPETAYLFLGQRGETPDFDFHCRMPQFGIGSAHFFKQVGFFATACRADPIVGQIAIGSPG